MNGRAAVVETSDLFHRAAEALRDAYLDYLSKLGSELNTLQWWVSTVSHRDYNSSRTFQQACWVRVAIELVSTRKTTDPLLIVVEDRALGSALSLNLPKAKVLGFDCRRRTSWHVDWLRVLAYRSVFLVRESCRLVRARGQFPLQDHCPAKPVTALVCPADKRTLGEDGPFRGAIFGDLSDQLKRVGESVALVPLISREMSYDQALKSLSHESLPVLVPHRYLRFRDLCWAVKQTLFAVPITERSLPQLEGMDVSPLVLEDIQRDWISNWRTEALLMAATVKHWEEAGLCLKRIIYPYENQPWERSLCWASRRFMPGTKLIAFQHCRLPRLHLKYFLGTEEEAIQPQPDYIVTLGGYSAQLLRKGGHSHNRIRVGGALRHQRFFSDAVKTGSDLNRDIVLMVLSFEQEETAELLDKAAELAELDSPLRIVLKAHPRLPFKAILKRRGARLPACLTISDEHLLALLGRTSVLVYGASTACIEAMAFEVPMVHVRPQCMTDHDPLELSPEVRLEAKNGRELREKVQWLLSHREAFVEQHRAQWKTIVADMLSPVTADTYRAFVE